MIPIGAPSQHDSQQKRSIRLGTRVATGLCVRTKLLHAASLEAGIAGSSFVDSCKFCSPQTEQFLHLFRKKRHARRSCSYGTAESSRRILSSGTLSVSLKLGRSTRSGLAECHSTRHVSVSVGICTMGPRASHDLRTQDSLRTLASWTCPFSRY